MFKSRINRVLKSSPKMKIMKIFFKNKYQHEDNKFFSQLFVHIATYKNTSLYISSLNNIKINKQDSVNRKKNKQKMEKKKL